jgi:hypothetical protein
MSRLLNRAFWLPSRWTFAGPPHTKSFFVYLIEISVDTQPHRLKKKEWFENYLLPPLYRCKPFFFETRLLL